MQKYNLFIRKDNVIGIMKIRDEILVNQFGQGLTEINKLENVFSLFDLR